MQTHFYIASVLIFIHIHIVIAIALLFHKDGLFGQHDALCSLPTSSGHSRMLA